ncbi:MAG: hypothetical protein ABI743_08555 [bacterium]
MRPVMLLGLLLLMTLPASAETVKPSYPDSRGLGAIDLSTSEVPNINVETADLHTLLTWLDITTKLLTTISAEIPESTSLNNRVLTEAAGLAIYQDTLVLSRLVDDPDAALGLAWSSIRLPTGTVDAMKMTVEKRLPADFLHHLGPGGPAPTSYLTLPSMEGLTNTDHETVWAVIIPAKAGAKGFTTDTGTLETNIKADAHPTGTVKQYAIPCLDEGNAKLLARALQRVFRMLEDTGKP